MSQHYLSSLARIASRKIQQTFYHLKQNSRIKKMERTGQFLGAENKIICFAHPRSATRSIGNILELISGHLNLNCFWGYEPLSQKVLQHLISRYHIIFLHRTQPGDFPGQFRSLDFKGFHIIRDPRNTLVSLYFSHRYSHELDQYTPDIKQDRLFLENHSEEEGILHLLQRSKQFTEATASLSEWNNRDPRLLEIRFENYAVNPEQAWRQILHFSGISISDQLLKEIATDYSFEI